MQAGAESIDDLAVLRSFTFRHVRQLADVHSRTLAGLSPSGAAVVGGRAGEGVSWT